MLVLTRKKDEKIIIDGEITIMVVGIQGNRVKLGITAGPETRIVRAELHQKAAEPAVTEFWVDAEELTVAAPLLV